MLLTAIGSIVSGVAAYQQSRYQAAIAKTNQRQANINADLAREIAERDAEDIGAQERGLLGELTSAQAASGLAVSSPSLHRARVRQRAIGYENQVRRIEAGNREYANYKTQASVYSAQASSYSSAGTFALIGGFIDAGAAIAGAPGGFNGGSFLGNAQPSQQSPGYIPVRTQRQQYYNAASLSYPSGSFA